MLVSYLVSELNGRVAYTAGLFVKVSLKAQKQPAQVPSKCPPRGGPNGA